MNSLLFRAPRLDITTGFSPVVFVSCRFSSKIAMDRLVSVNVTNTASTDRIPSHGH